MKKIKLLLVDDHSLLRMGLQTLFATKDDITVVGQAANGEEAVTLASTLKPDVVIMDLMMPKMSGAEATRRIRKALPDTKILLLTSFGTSEEIALALKYGADGVMTKDMESNEIVTAVRRLAAGEPLAQADKLLQPETCEPLQLSSRQLEILRLVAKGLSNPEIAKVFGISLITVKKHLVTVFERIGASSRAEAVAIAMQHHLLTI